MTGFRSHTYWQDRYESGGTSGPGSYGDPARYKADFVNAFVREHEIESVVEFGCGDGNQLALAEYPRYHGLDVTHAAVERCRTLFADDLSKEFAVCDPCDIPLLHSDLALSMDVVYHLTEDDAYEMYMRALFHSADRFVIIYGDVAGTQELAEHCRWRDHEAWVRVHATPWDLVQLVRKPDPRDEYQDFYVYGK